MTLKYWCVSYYGGYDPQSPLATPTRLQQTRKNDSGYHFVGVNKMVGELL